MASGTAVVALNDLLATASKYGLGGVLAVLLVYKLAVSFEDKLEAVDAKVTAAASAADTRAAAQILLLKAICENTATTDSERAVCREAGR